MFAVVAFLPAVALARLVSYVVPRFHFTIAGAHVHHYVFGIFMLAAAGYLALVFKGPRATAAIALLYGLAIGLTFDEYGLWVNPPFVRGARFKINGLEIVAFVYLAIAATTFVFRRRHVLAAASSSAISRTTRARDCPRAAS